MSRVRAMELIKAVGGISWIVGVVLLFVVPWVGLLILGVAVLATVASVTRIREQRHHELLEATRRQQRND